MIPKWYDKIDWEPVLWFILSAAMIFAGFYIFSAAPADNKMLSAVGTLFIALGGAGIARVRSSKKIQ